jgi:hypothetical protein
MRLEINITKNGRRWSVESIAKREGWNDAYTYSGHSTLASSLWHTIDQNDPTLRVSSVTVKGKPLTLAEVYRIIEKDLSSGALAYSLPAYKRVLGL